MLTGVKDIDTIILNKLNDQDLVNMCQVNKLSNRICKDRMFWLNRIITKYKLPIEILNRYRKGRSWFEYYINDIRKINSENAIDYLIVGSTHDRLDYVIISLQMGANIHDRNDNAIIWASTNGHIDIVKYLVEKGIDIHTVDDAAIRGASKYGYTDIVRYLTKAGANIHVYDDAPIRWASENGHIDTVRYLVEAGANIHARDDDALRWAQANKHLEVVNYLKSLP